MATSRDLHDRIVELQAEATEVERAINESARALERAELHLTSAQAALDELESG